ncbi:MAG: methyltransferase domain-containing protein [Pseudomonadota bacterium]
MTPGLERLRVFLEGLRSQIYPEPEGAESQDIIRHMVAQVLDLTKLAPGARILDLGCGKGLALCLFGEAGMRATGITLGSDARHCRDKGLDVIEADFSFLDFTDESFDLVWCRQALEHSVFPLFTLSEMRRILKSKAHAYVEVPAPETACRHEANPNHYSVFGKAAWLALFAKAGFSSTLVIDINYVVPAGPDTLWGFLLRRD